MTKQKTMTTTYPELPDVVTREEWLAERKELLKKEKDFTRQRDQLNSQRRRLQMVRIEKEYAFEEPKGRSGETIFNTVKKKLQFTLKRSEHFECGTVLLSYSKQE